MMFRIQLQCDVQCVATVWCLVCIYSVMYCMKLQSDVQNAATVCSYSVGFSI